MEAKIGFSTFLLLLGSLSSAFTSKENSIVSTKYGPVQGAVRQFPADSDQPIRSVRKFLGVPYAAAPVGELRFQPPRTPAPWKPHMYNATYYRSVCYQDPTYNEYFWPNSSHPQSDDCLYLNIYTPANSSSLFPVMVYIHGGGYEAGSPVVSPGDVIPLWGVVLVSIQYRLGPLGFITTGDSIAAGNYGMLDQVEALKWVQENIANFGGDPSSVTIFGESAGGSSVGLHMLSPLSEGLFHKAIAISGVDFSPFAVETRLRAVHHTRKLATRLGCPVEPIAQMLSCLRATEAHRFPIDDVNVWKPVVDGAFLHDWPEKLRAAGKAHGVPFMAGFTREDGAYFIQPSGLTLDTFSAYSNAYTTAAIGRGRDIPDVALKTVSFFYTPWPYTADAFKLKRGLASIITDCFFTAPIHAELSLHSETAAPVYLYQFTHRSKLNPSPPWKGCAHKDDTPYEFGFPLMNLTIPHEFDDTDRDVSRLVITLFTNFAKHGNPTPEPVRGVTWDRFNSSHMTYLLIKEQPEMALNYRPTKVAFWNTFYPNLASEAPPARPVQTAAAPRTLARSLHAVGLFAIAMIFI